MSVWIACKSDDNNINGCSYQSLINKTNSVIDNYLAESNHLVIVHSENHNYITEILEQIPFGLQVVLLVSRNLHAFAI